MSQDEQNELLRDLRSALDELAPLGREINELKMEDVRQDARITNLEGAVPELKTSIQETMEREVGRVREDVAALAAKMDGGGHPIPSQIKQVKADIDDIKDTLSRQRDSSRMNKKAQLMLWTALITGGLGFLSTVVQALIELIQ